MWTPASFEEIEEAAADGRLEERPAVEAKRELPRKGRSHDAAVDIAAMTTAGGTLIYGVAEDEQQRPRIPHPIELGGAAERIDQIAQTSISEPPYIEVRELPRDHDAQRGYLVVLVPKSPRAPHQVSVKGDLRYYGRGAKGNRTLTEGEVARLYHERERQEVDANRLLEAIVALAPVEPQDGLGYLHAFAHPATRLDDDAWDRAVGGGDGELLGALTDALKEGAFAGYDPALCRQANWRRRGADVWTVDSSHGREDENPRHLVRCDVNMDGRGQLFCGRAAEVHDASSFYIFEQLIAGNLASFLSVMGTVYERAGYHGAVDVGVAVTGIEGTTSMLARQRNAFITHSYAAEGYYRTFRVLAGELSEPRDVVRRLVQRLVDATVAPGVDPFEGLG